MVFKVLIESCGTITDILCRSATAAVEERSRACLNDKQSVCISIGICFLVLRSLDQTLSLTT